MDTELANPGLWSRAQRASVERLHIRLESFVVLVALSGAMAILSPFFLSLSNFLNILLATSTIGVLAIAATYVIGSGGLDLSLGSVMGLAGVVGAYVAVNLGAPSLVALAACIVAGGIAGYINGLLVTRAFVPAFIVTLGMLGLARGLALVISGGRVIYGLPALMVYVGQGRPLGCRAKFGESTSGDHEPEREAFLRLSGELHRVVPIPEPQV